MRTKLTQQEKIVTLMIKRKNTQEWFIPPDFMAQSLGDLFVGYEASARFSELAKQNPYMIESKHDGKYTKRRIRWEAMADWLYLLPKDLRHLFHKYNLTKGIERPQQADQMTILPWGQ